MTNHTMTDWESMGRVATQTQDRGFGFLLRFQKLDRVFGKLGQMFEKLGRVFHFIFYLFSTLFTVD